MTTITRTIALTEDDSAYNAGAMDPAAVSRTLSPTGPTYAFFRFRDIPVPQGAEIVSAQFTASWVFYSSGRAVVVPLLVDNVPVPIPDLAASMGTLESPIFDADLGSTQEVGPLIQQIVDRPGWAAGNALALVAKRYSGTVAARMLSSDGLSYAATLTVEYQERVVAGVQVAGVEASSSGSLPTVRVMGVEAYTDAPPPVAGPAKVWTGDQWTEAVPHVWSGDQWVPVQPYVWTGDQWAPTT